MSYANYLVEGADNDPEHSAVKFLTQLAGGHYMRRSEMATAAHARQMTPAQVNQAQKNGKAGIKRSWSESNADADLIRQIQRKARRKIQGELVRQLDAKLPNTFRRGVSFNGAGGRALGMAGRSLHDVLEDTVMALAWLRPRKSASQREGGDQCSSKMSADVGPLMRDFMASTGKSALDILADANLFVLSLGLRDRGLRRKATQNHFKDITCECVSTGRSTPRPPAPRAMTAGLPQTILPSVPSAQQCQHSPSVTATRAGEGPTSTSTVTNTSPFLVKMARDSLALAPLVLEKSVHPRLPPIRIIPTHSGHVIAEHGAQTLPVTCKVLCKTEQSQEELLEELRQVAGEIRLREIRLREQALLLLLLQQSPALCAWPSLCNGLT